MKKPKPPTCLDPISRCSPMKHDQPIVVEGSIDRDGMVQVLEPVPLPPGRVRVTIESLSDHSDSASEDWLTYLLRARAESLASGTACRTRSDIDSQVDMLRDEWDLS
jgi:hypothetical protein